MNRSIIKTLASLLLAGLTALASVGAPAQTIDLKGAGWEYRWGDSPFDARGVPSWILEDDPEQWTAIAFPSNPPGRDGHENVWYRITLPEGRWRDPVLYVFSIDLIVEVYLEGRRIYHYGHFNAQGQGVFEGWPWHMIVLPPDAAGKTLYFRIYSNYLDIGLWGEVKLIERLDLLHEILSNSVERLITSGFNLLIALLALVFALLQTGQRRNLIALALFALASGGMILSGAQANQLFFNGPLFWDYLGAGGYFLIPVAMGMLLEQWLQPASSRLLNALWKLNLLYLIGALGAALLGLISLDKAYPVFDALLVLTLALMSIASVRALKQTDSDQRLILTAFSLLGSLLLLDMAVAHNLLPWGEVPLTWGSLAFSLAIVFISLRHYARTQRQLRELNTSLEHKVIERTAALEAMAQRESERARLLQMLSYQDGLTGLKNRRFLDEVLARELALAERNRSALSVLVCDIDHFKHFNDQYGHAAGDLVIQSVAHQLIRVFRQTDIVCRYGGEEFVILMPGASAADCYQRAETLRAQVARQPVEYLGESLGPITISVGIASWPEMAHPLQELLYCADQALYRAKEGGRNRVERAG